VSSDSALVERSVTLITERQLVLFVEELFLGLPASFLGYLEVSAPDGVYITAARVEAIAGGKFQMAAIQPQGGK